jgi:phosphoglycerol transferase MdoB-like AlkP superfamily enzyme
MTRGMKILMWVAAAFLGVSLATRVGLAWFSGDSYEPAAWARFLSIGLVFDLVVLAWVLLPWALYDALVPDGIRWPLTARLERAWLGLWAILYLAGFLGPALAEFAFWAEFASRFDFIAVDYLVYTHEVIGNIRESYPVALWTAGLIAVSLGLWWLTWPEMRNRAPALARARWARAAVVALACAGGTGFADMELAAGHANAYVEQLSMNGLFALFHAYRHNELDYGRYYPTLPAQELDAGIRRLVEQPGAAFLGPTGIDRKIAPARATRDKVNVVLISVESLSADFLGRFGNHQHLTPNLDRLADEGLVFTDLYATGTRTVRGLEALSIGTPPTPGQSIVRRPNNAGLENLGEEFEEQGWKPLWIYGGYGFFDNMNAYFQANHYTVVDRTDLDAEAIPTHHENIWGVADEDLFTLALRRFDAEHAAGNRFFAHIMTTSNHRPFTFPEGRVDLPQKKREGAVKYTDWALGDLIRRASAKPWFANTLFVITADHTAKAAGKTDLPAWRYHIPMIWYAPKLIEPGVMSRLMSQVDIGPTLMGWMGFGYQSRFFGYDMFRLEPGRERAFISTYQKLGYLKGGRLVTLDVNRKPLVSRGTASSQPPAAPQTDEELTREAVAWYQAASSMFRAGLLKDIEEAGEAAEPRPAN